MRFCADAVGQEVMTVRRRIILMIVQLNNHQRRHEQVAEAGGDSIEAMSLIDCRCVDAYQIFCPYLTIFGPDQCHQQTQSKGGCKLRIIA